MQESGARSPYLANLSIHECDRRFECMRLAVQDFAFESNEQRMRAAAHLMASSLAGAYAMNLCREPMRASLGSQLHALLKPNLDPPVSCWHTRLLACVKAAHALLGTMRYP